MTFEELKDEVSGTIQDPAYDSKVGRYINDVMLGLSEVIELPQLKTYSTVTTSTTSSVISLPADCSKLKFLSYEGASIDIILGGLEKLLYADPDLDDTGGIYLVAQEGTLLYYTARPTTATSLPIVYYRKPTDMSANADTPDGLPSQFHHDALVYGAALKAWIKIEEGLEGDNKLNTIKYTKYFNDALKDIRAYTGQHVAHTGRSIFGV